MVFVPGGIIVNPDIFNMHLFSVELYHRYYQVDDAVGAQYTASVPVGLFIIMIILFNDNIRPVPGKNSVERYRCIVQRRKNHSNRGSDFYFIGPLLQISYISAYSLLLTILKSLFQRIPPYSLSILSQMTRGFPMTWSSGTKPQNLESAELCRLSPIMK